MTPIQPIQDPRGDGGSKVSMKGGHGPWLDTAPPSRSHGELVALPHRLDEGSDVSEVVGAIGVAHDDVASPDERNRVDICASETALGCPQNTRAGSEGNFGGAVGGAV